MGIGSAGVAPASSASCSARSGPRRALGVRVATSCSGMRVELRIPVARGKGPYARGGRCVDQDGDRLQCTSGAGWRESPRALQRAGKFHSAPERRRQRMSPCRGVACLPCMGHHAAPSSDECVVSMVIRWSRSSLVKQRPNACIAVIAILQMVECRTPHLAKCAGGACIVPVPVSVTCPRAYVLQRRILLHWLSCSTAAGARHSVPCRMRGSASHHSLAR